VDEERCIAVGQASTLVLFTVGMDYSLPVLDDRYTRYPDYYTYASGIRDDCELPIDCNNDVGICLLLFLELGTSTYHC